MTKETEDRKYDLSFMNEISSIRLVHITRAVNLQTPKEKAGLLSDAEGIYFDHLVAEAKRHLEKYGSWPVFEMPEIDYDEPALDIYNEPAENWSKKR